jgi:hypothetical protein
MSNFYTIPSCLSTYFRRSFSQIRIVAAVFLKPTKCHCYIVRISAAKNSQQFETQQGMPGEVLFDVSMRFLRLFSRVWKFIKTRPKRQWGFAKFYLSIFAIYF